MRSKRAREVSIFLLVYWLVKVPVITGFPSWPPDCSDGLTLKQALGLHKTICGLALGDQSKDQIEDVYKRFLFHYSKAQNSLQSVQSESQSVHPLMHLSPKLSKKRKKLPVLRNRRFPQCMERVV